MTGYRRRRYNVSRWKLIFCGSWNRGMNVSRPHQKKSHTSLDGSSDNSCITLDTHSDCWHNMHISGTNKFDKWVAKWVVSIGHGDRPDLYSFWKKERRHSYRELKLCQKYTWQSRQACILVPFLQTLPHSQVDALEVTITVLDLTLTDLYNRFIKFKSR